MPESAYGPTNNCVGIGDVLRRRGHRVVFIVEESFAGTLIMLMAVAAVFNLTVVPQICAWADGWSSSGPGLDKAGLAAQPRQDFGDDIF